jgi:hypothetical protein
MGMAPLFPPRISTLKRGHVSGWFLLALTGKDPFITAPFRLELVHRFHLSESEMCTFFSALSLSLSLTLLGHAGYTMLSSDPSNTTV